MVSKMTLGAVAFLAGTVGGEIRAATAQSGETPREALEDVKKAAREAKEGWDDDQPESASARALREVPEPAATPKPAAAPVAAAAPDPAPEPEAAPEPQASISQNGTLHYTDEQGAVQEAPFKKWWTVGFDANVGAFAYAMAGPDAEGNPREKPATFDFETNLFANAWNAVIVSANLASDSKHLNNFRFGLGTEQAIGRDTLLTLELPLAVNTDGLNFGPRIGVEQHFPTHLLPELAAGLFAGIDVPTKNLFAGDGVHVNRFHLNAEVLPHLFEATQLITIEPLVQARLDSFIQGNAAGEMDSAFRFEIGARVTFGQGAEKNIRRAIRREDEHAVDEAKAQPAPEKPDVEITAVDTKAAGTELSSKER